MIGSHFKYLHSVRFGIIIKLLYSRVILHSHLSVIKSVGVILLHWIKEKIKNFVCKFLKVLLEFNNFFLTKRFPFVVT